MAYPRGFLRAANFELAFERLARGTNKDYKAFYRHYLPSYRLGLRENVQDLIDDLRRGRYRPSPSRVVFQPKKSGILRPITLLSLEDLIVYQAICNHLANKFRRAHAKFALTKSFGSVLAKEDSPFFFRSWKECYRQYNTAIKRAWTAGHTYYAEFDLVSFFELIDHSLLRARLETKEKNTELLELLFDCLEAWSLPQSGTNARHGVPQGPEASAFLAECFLMHFDAKKLKEAVYLRYVDDIKLLANGRLPLRRALVRLDLLSKELGLVPQAQKIAVGKAESFGDLLKNVPSALANVGLGQGAEAKKQKDLIKVFRGSLKKVKRRWIVEDATKFKFSLIRLNARKDVRNRIAPLLVDRPDLSWVLAEYLKKFGEDRDSAEVLLDALLQDPTYDASAAHYIEAMDACEPWDENTQFRRAINTVLRRSEEKTLRLVVPSLVFRCKRRSAREAAKLISKEKDPLTRSLVIHHAFGDGPGAPFKPELARDLLAEEIKGECPDAARFAASLLLGDWPWFTPATWTPPKGANRSVHLMMKALGLRRNRPAKEGVLPSFFRDYISSRTTFPWSRALGRDFRDAENRCLRLQKLMAGDPTARVLILDTFNEVLIQNFSLKSSALSQPYVRAAGGKQHPDYGNWLRHPALASALPTAQPWLLRVHEERVRADLAHAKTRGKKGGKSTKPISYQLAESLLRQASAAWTELIRTWRKSL